MTLGTITRRGTEVANHVKRQFGDESLVQINDSDIIRWIDDAQRSLSSKLKLIKGRATVAAVSRQKEYTLPQDAALQIESVHFDGKKVTGTTLAQAEEIIGQHDKDEPDVGDPQLWYIWGKTLTFWPAPEQPKNITVYYSGTTPPFTALTSLLSVPDEFYDAIINYVMAKAYELDEEFNAASDQMQRYLNTLTDQDENETEGQHLTYPMITLVDED